MKDPVWWLWAVATALFYLVLGAFVCRIAGVR